MESYLPLNIFHMLYSLEEVLSKWAKTPTNEPWESGHSPVMFLVGRIGSCGLVTCLRHISQSRLTQVPGKPGIRVTWLRPKLLESQGAVLPGSHLLRQGHVYRLRSLFLGRGMPTGHKAFLEPATHLKFGSCLSPSLKKVMCHTLSWWEDQQIQRCYQPCGHWNYIRGRWEIRKQRMTYREVGEQSKSCFFKNLIKKRL